MRYAAFLLPLRRELKFGEVGGGDSRARRTLPRRGKPCQGQGEKRAWSRKSFLFLLPLRGELKFGEVGGGGSRAR